jgi:hypothetical protein
LLTILVLKLLPTLYRILRTEEQDFLYAWRIDSSKSLTLEKEVVKNGIKKIGVFCANHDTTKEINTPLNEFNRIHKDANSMIHDVDVDSI